MNLNVIISDRESYYIEIGYDSETACLKAMEHMGNADLLGEEMNRLHNEKALKVCSIISIILAAAIYFIYDIVPITSLSALCYGYLQNAIYLFIAVSFLILITVSYCCAVKTRQSRLMYSCAYISVFLSISLTIKMIDLIFPLADFQKAVEEIKVAGGFSDIYNNYEIYKFMFAVILFLCLITAFVHGISAFICSYEFKSFEKGKGNMIVINRFDSYKKLIISVCTVFFAVFSVNAVFVLNMFI